MSDTPVGQGLGDRHYGSIEIPINKLALGASAPTAGNTDMFLFYGYTYTPPVLVDDGAVTFRVPEDWFIGTDMTFSILWACNETYAFQNGEVRWRIIVEPIAIGEVVGGGTETTIDGVDTNLPAAARTMAEQTLTIPNALLVRADLVKVVVTLRALTAGTLPTADPEVYSLMVRYARRFVQPSAV